MCLFDPALLAHVEEQRAYNATLMEMMAAMPAVGDDDEGLRWLRESMARADGSA